MTIFNQSFELPDGTAAVLVAASPEPYALVAGDLLRVTVVADGGLSTIEEYIADSADFSNIAAATAAELASAMTAAMPSLAVTDSSGFVSIECRYYGARSSIAVSSGGGIQAACSFPTTTVRGTSYLGPPQGWAITSSNSYWESAEFAGFNFGSPIETFETGWSQTTFALSESPFTETFETGWITIPVGETFGAALFGVFQYESFESGWNISLATTTLSPATFNSEFSPTQYDEFMVGWDHIAVTSSWSSASFADDQLIADTFNVVNAATHVVEVVDGASLGTYRVVINGTIYPYTTELFDTNEEILEALRGVINANTQMSASAVINNGPSRRIDLTPLNPRSGLADVVFVEGPTSSDISVVLATEYSYLVAYWVGQDFNYTL